MSTKSPFRSQYPSRPIPVSLVLSLAVAVGFSGLPAQAEPATSVDPTIEANDGLAWSRWKRHYDRWLRYRAKRFSRSREYRNSTGLEQIEAAKGYARIIGKTGGKGVRVAVVGNGIDDSSRDLDVKERSVAEDDSIRFEPPVDSTAIAGIIAAKRNKKGTHGVAYKADLIDIDGQIISGILAAGGYTSVDERKALIGSIADPPFGGDFYDFHADNPALEADVIHIESFRTIPRFERYAGPIQLALDRDKIVVVGTGSDANNEFTAPSLVFNRIEGSAILVGAVDANGQLVAGTRSCEGGVSDVCMVAPGKDIRSTAPGGGVGTFSGTDVAAAHVAGAAAVVKAAFPGVSSNDVTNRLLTTATDLGDPGVDDTFGHGLLNLNRALTPKGKLGLPTTSTTKGPKATLSSSTLDFGNGFALDGQMRGLLDRVVALDDQGFPFGVDLGDHAEVQDRTTGLAAFVGSGRSLTSGLMTADGKTRFAFSRDADAVDVRSNDPHEGAFAPSGTSIDDRPDVPSAQFATEVGAGIEVFVGLNDGSATDAGMEEALASRDGLLFQPGSFLAPFDQLAGPSLTGGGTSIDLGARTTLTLSAFGSTTEDTELPETSTQKIELSHVLANDIELRFGYGWLEEQDGFLGSQSDGAFGNTTATSSFVNAALLAPVTDEVRLFGSYTQGQSSIAASGLLNDWSAVRSESFGVGLLADDVAEAGDHLSVMVGQPVRLESARAKLSVPVGRTEDGQIVTEKQTVDLAPSAREIAFETTYQFSLDDEDASLIAGAFARLNPDHDPDAKPDLGIGVRYRLSF